MQKITLIIKEIYSNELYEHTAKATYCTTYDNLFLRIWNLFKTFKRNSVIKSMSIDIQFEKRTMSCLFERFVGFSCSRPITYDLSIYGEKYNCKTIKNGIKHQVKVFGAVTGLHTTYTILSK